MLRQWLAHPLEAWQNQKKKRATAALHELKSRYHTFRALLEDNNRAVSLLTDLGMKLRSSNLDRNTRETASELVNVTGEMVDKLEQLGAGESNRISAMHVRLTGSIDSLLTKSPEAETAAPVIPLPEVTEDMRSLVGGKAAVLARLLHSGNFRVPDGFVIPLSSCLLFLEQGNLNLRLHTLLQPYIRDTSQELPANIEEEVRNRIMNTSLPPTLRSAINSAARPFFNREKGPGLAVRSSGVGEDSLRLSFAGQYSTVLNVVSQDELENGIKEVIASSYSKRNLSYRLHAGLDPLYFDLAVLCLGMVHAKAAGTLFTRDPNNPSSDKMLVSAVYGLGELAVGGSIMTDIYRPDRSSGVDPAPSISRKERKMVGAESGGIREKEVVPAEQELPSLQPPQLKYLCSLGLEIEKMENSPQDIEWAVAADDEIFLLQARPFRMSRQSSMTDQTGLNGRHLLVSGGVTASRGRGTGKVWVVKNRQDLNQVPEGPYILVMHQSLVDAVPALRRAHGVIVDLGNPIDHLSCVAREYNIPMITGLGNGVEQLSGHEWLMLDADNRKVLNPLEHDIAEARELAASLPELEEIEDFPSDPLAAELYKLIVPLSLTDAYGPTFSIAECRTLHDLVRYIHEKAVITMFEMGDETLEKSSGAVRHLESDIPFMISIIDLGGGLIQQIKPGRWVKPADIASFPLKALWLGITDTDVNWGPPSGGVAMGSVMSRFLTDQKSSRPVGLPNYAIITRDYLNLNARMDFHFIMIDSVCGIDSRSNYIRFRFKGGGTSEMQRRRRVGCIAEILGASGFACDARGDLITAELQGAPQQIIEEKLGVLGRLLGFTRLLDAAMRSEEAPKLAAEAFLSGNYQIVEELMSTESNGITNDSYSQ